MGGPGWRLPALAFGTRARQGSAMRPAPPAEGPPARPAPALARLRRHWLALGLAALCLLVEALLLGAERGLWGSTRWRLLAYLNGGFWAGLVRAGWDGNYALQPAAMFLSHPLLHAGFSHLATNVIALVALGAMMRNRVGQAGLALVLAASVLGGAAAFAAFGPLGQPMVGISGGLFGLAGALLVWVGRDAWQRGLWPWDALGLAAALMALNLLSAWAVGWQMAWEAHLGGFLAGAATGAALGAQARPLSP
jgi:rhomboid protease GluP